MIKHWKMIEDFPNYEVSNTGKIRRMTNTRNKKAGDEIAQCRSWCKRKRRLLYPRVLLWNNGRAYNRYVHVLVAEAFLGKKPQGMTVNHKDCDYANPCLNNLEYLSLKDNVHHAIANGRVHPKTGSECCNAKLNESIVRTILLRLGEHPPWGLQTRIAEELKVSPSTVNMIYLGKRWKRVKQERLIPTTEADVKSILRAFAAP